MDTINGTLLNTKPIPLFILFNRRGFSRRGSGSAFCRERGARDRTLIRLYIFISFVWYTRRKRFKSFKELCCNTGVRLVFEW